MGHGLTSIRGTAPRAGIPAGTGGDGGEAHPSPPTAPVPATAHALLARSDAELVAAGLAREAGERFVHAHLAALRAGAALIEVTGRPRRRPVPRSVWDMVAAVAPELSGWTSFFASGAALRAAVEAGRGASVEEDRAEQALRAAEDFQDAVRASLGISQGSVTGTTSAGRAAS